MLAGRNVAPLSADDILRVANTFVGIDPDVIARFDAATFTAFRVSRDENGTAYGEIVYGPDIYPGPGIVDPNSALSLKGAVAHELTHYHRWFDHTALDDSALEHLDEALTSLAAAARYESKLNSTDINGLIADAMQRINLHLEETRRRAIPRNNG